MKRSNFNPSRKIPALAASTTFVALVLGVLALAQARAADDKKPAEPAAAIVATNAPVAVFDLTAAGVKDPFFPLSTRSAIPVPVMQTNAAPAQVNAKSFEIGAMIHTDNVNDSLVSIGGHPFALNETFDIMPKGGTAKVAVTVIQIKAFSVVIRVDGYSEPLEISMPIDAR